MKIIVFENDSDFEVFAVKPPVYVKTVGDTSYCDWDFTDEYLEEVDNGTMFFIKDKNSKIVRRHAVVNGIIAKTVKNVSMYDDLLIECDNPKIEIENYTENI